MDLRTAIPGMTAIARARIVFGKAVLADRREDLGLGDDLGKPLPAPERR
jgi:hypothetical protein